MRIRAQVGMVMNLDKCIGCHTCSVTCKQVWTNRPGAEYMWFNDVETKPGVGYPKRWEDQERWRGGWELDRKGRLRLKAGGRIKKLLSIFSNPDLPQIDDYYVDQAKCRGWRFCVSGCPYKKVYFNHQTGKAEKCTLCYPRIEAGLPTICSETCVGRIRYIGLVLYDSDRIEAAASVPDEHDLLDSQREVFLDPFDPEVRWQAVRD